MKKLITAAMTLALALSAGATVRYVTPSGTGDGSSWQNAGGDLQAAIDASQAGDQIWVKAGTYAPTSLIKSNKLTSKAFILKDGVSLYGGFAGTESSLADRQKGAEAYDFANATILDADDDTPDVWTRTIDSGSSCRWTWEQSSNNVTGTKNNSTHVLYCAAQMTQPTVIDGFTLRGGNANIHQAKAHGGAVYALGTVDLRNCRILENSSYFPNESMTDSNSYGGAVYLDGGTMTDCYIASTYCHSSYGRGVGGGVYAKNAIISGCTFVDCVATDEGGGAYMQGGTLTDCTFERCYAGNGGAVYNNGATVEDIRVFDCRSIQGGGVYNKGTLRRALVRGCYSDATEYTQENSLLGGGGLWIESGDAVNCALFNNTAFKGGGAYVVGGRIINSTIVNNASRLEGQENLTTNATGLYNCISDVATAADNFMSMPSFAGRATTAAQETLLRAADLSLAPGSAFIDGGTPLEGFTSGTDLAGNPRVSGSAIDAGAYEYQGAAAVPTITLTFAPGTESARIGIGGATGYEFTIDWGDGNPVSYTAQGYYTHALTGNTVRVYGDDVIVLQAPSQNIIGADLSRASKLIRVMLGQNGLSQLTLGNHPSLTGLYAEQNALTSLDVAGCPALTVLDVHENAIASAIDCSAMSALSKVDVADNHIASLTLPKHSTLYEVDASNNELTAIDVTGLGGVEELSLYGNKLTAIDLTGMTALTDLSLYENELTAIDLSPCTALETFSAAENRIASIDVSTVPTLTGLYLQDNELSELNISANPNIRWLNVNNNNLSALDVTAQRSLSILNAGGNHISSIDLSNNSSVSSLDLSGNGLTEVNVSAMSYLSQCHLENNALTALDLSRNAYLYGLFVGNNRLSTLDISHNTYLQRLEAQGNALTALDVTANTGLQELLLQSNKLDAATLNSLLAALPDVSNVTPTETTGFLRQLNVSFMPGTKDADISVAEGKGWYVTADYDQEPETSLTSLNIQINRAGDAIYDTASTSIEWTNDQQTAFRIVGFNGTGVNLACSVDADGNVKVFPQVCGTDEDNNYLMIVNADNTDGNPMAISNTYVAGTYDGTTLTLQPWNLIRVPYTFTENLGTYYTENMTSTFVPGNATMTYGTGTRADETTVNLYAEVQPDNSVMLYNWAGIAAVKMTAIPGGWSLDKDSAAARYDGKSYYLRNADGEAVTTTFVADARNITFGPWRLAAATGTGSLGAADNAVLSFTFDLPVTVGIDSVFGETPVEVIYYNAAGQKSHVPFEGINIVVSRYSDGRTATAKRLIRR